MDVSFGLYGSHRYWCLVLCNYTERTCPHFLLNESSYRLAKSCCHRAQNAPFALIVELLDLLQVSSLIVSQR
eukprot:2257-Heterococcus_DN1.PRE.2